MVKKTLQNSPKKFYCEKCDYYAKRLSDFNKHLQTKKHNDKNDNKNSPDNNQYHCPCGKNYKFQSGYCRHRKVCKYDDSVKLQNIEKDAKETKNMMEIMMKVLDENQRLQQQITEMIPKIGNNNNNKIINIQMFLNEKCGDAMSIQNFAKQLMITMDDLSKDKKDCISNVVLKNLEPLALTERPFHHIKNKEWYIKDEVEGWKENSGINVIKNAEYGIQKNWCAEFEKQYPNWMDDDALREKYIEIAGSTTRDLDEKVKFKLLRELGKQVKLTQNDIISL